MLFKMKLFATNKNIGKYNKKKHQRIKLEYVFLCLLFLLKKKKEKNWENPAVKSQFIKVSTFFFFRYDIIIFYWQIKHKVLTTKKSVKG